MAMDHGAASTVAHNLRGLSPSKNDDLIHRTLLRDIVGPLPFRDIPVDSAWITRNDRTVSRLAESIYTDRTFDHLPILADALEDAGCDNADLLAHCRGPGPHVRGCWVVDLILGKT